MTNDVVHVDLGDRSYPIHIGPDAFAEVCKELGKVDKVSHVFILTDENIERLHGASIRKSLPQALILVLPAGEQTKSYEGLETVLDWLLDHRADRKSVLVALGGGVIGDLGGLAAALALRGISYIQIPTTLLAQVDSSVGGKTAIDTRQGKNLVGAFYQPQAVYADTSFLSTLPLREMKAGYAEIVKYAFIRDAGFFEWLETNGTAVLAGDPAATSEAVKQSCLHKARVVAEDEKEEKDIRALLNFGHTFGHALEKLLSYDGRLLHGEAVAIGMTMAFDLSVRMNLCEAADHDRAVAHMKGVGLLTSVAQVPALKEFSVDQIVNAMMNDKKFAQGKMAFVLCRRIGEAFVSREAVIDDVRKTVENNIKG